MKTDVRISELLRQHRNEDVHTGFVTNLALELFDAVNRCLPLDRADRRILDAASRLHDIGYSSSPHDHVASGAQIVLKTRLHGFNEEERRLIVGIMLLHAGDFRARLANHPVFKDWRELMRVKRLGAILRVADALDHGHIQDAEILRIRCSKKRVLLIITSPCHPANAEAARKKSVLWHEVFDTPLTITGNFPDKPRTPLRRHDQILPALRKLFFLDYRRLTELATCEPAELPTVGEIHAARVALRRSAALLRFFADELKTTSAAKLRVRLQELSTKLGFARDASVWNRFLASKTVTRAMDGRPGWAEYLAGEQLREHEIYASLRDIWARPAWREGREHFGHFLRIELPAIENQATAAAAAARVLKKRGKKLLKRCTARLLADTERLHDTRRRMRRLRYLAEFFAPVLPRRQRRLARKLHRIETDLGKLHDIDIAVAKLHEDPRPIAANLALTLAQRRRELERDVLQ